MLETAPGVVLELFNASAQMKNIGLPAVRIMAAAWLISIPNLVMASALQGLSLPWPSMSLTMLRQAALPVLLALILSRFGNLNLIWAAFVLAEILGIPAALALWRRGSRSVLVDEIQKGKSSSGKKDPV